VAQGYAPPSEIHPGFRTDRLQRVDKKTGTVCARLSRLFAMSTPETPTQTLEPNASDARVAARDDSDAAPAALGAPDPGAASGAPDSGPSAPGDPTASGPTESPELAVESDALDADAQSNGHGAAMGVEAAALSTEHGASTATPQPSDKRRRKRRRKKKPGAVGAVTEGGSTEGGESEGADPSAPHEITGSVPAIDPAETRARVRERKPGPSRERPPVNAGDIVFGKILEITDEAILVDIPGKAHAIFDRRELLLPDDDDARPSPRPSDAVAGGEEVALPRGGDRVAARPGEAVEALPADGGGIAPDAGEVSTTLAGELGATSVDDATRSASAAEATTSSGPVQDSVAPVHVAAVPDLPKEPKVPHVILEVGADFIGVVHNDGGRGGLVVLTHHPNRAEKAKPAIERAYNDKATILGLVTGAIKGGAEVDVDGVRAFAPGSHVDLRLGADLSYLVGKRLPFFVTQYAKRGRDVVLSRKSLLEEEARKSRADALARLKVGQDLDGVVRSVVPFGAFIDVGGAEGLVPLQEMSHNRADGPSDVFKAGEPTRVRVIKIDDKGKIWLSRKATVPDPWQQVAQKYATGTRHSGKIARLQPFGAFVELESGVDGLIHTQDLSIKRIESPSDVVKVGDAIEVVVSHIDPTQHKIALHPAPHGDAAAEPPQRVAPHKPVKAKVVNIESGGLVVRILGVTGRNARGYVTAAGTGTPRGTELRKAFNVGQEIEAKVIEMDPRRGEVKLSIKALSEDQERNAYQNYRQQLKAEARFTFGDLLAKKGNPGR